MYISLVYYAQNKDVQKTADSLVFVIKSQSVVQPVNICVCLSWPLEVGGPPWKYVNNISLNKVKYVSVYTEGSR